jgi:hypothetical protein
MRLLTIVTALFVLAVGQAFAQYDPCDIPPGIYRTQTQGGWGANCHGGNAGCLRDNNFATVFPSGITIGGIYTIHFTSSSAVAVYLPAGTTVGFLTSNHVDPTAATEAGVFASQVLALAISLGFSEAGVPGFGDLGSLVIFAGVHNPTGPFCGYTVDEVFALANIVLGGNLSALPDGISLSDLNDVVDAINNNFVDGEESNGYLVEEECEILPVELTAEPKLVPGDRRLTLSFSVADERDVTCYEILRDGLKVMELQVANGSYTWVDENLMNGRRYEYIIWALELGQRKQLSYEGKNVWAGMPTSEAQSVAEYALNPCHPNPFNPETQITYDIKEAGLVTLKVYNMLGREIATLVNEKKAAGQYSVKFSGRDLPSGVYLCRLDVNGFTALQKLVLLK